MNWLKKPKMLILLREISRLQTLLESLNSFAAQSPHWQTLTDRERELYWRQHKLISLGLRLAMQRLAAHLTIGNKVPN